MIWERHYVWHQELGARPHVTEGCQYRMGDGEIEIESITQIEFPDITPVLAGESGFL